ncbi:MAG: hypothetical protein NDJ92_01990 [Thermoanaerobaculia bacterium]|nr:hypothetical protein [Thermoanaerobaculia bacterium]
MFTAVSSDPLSGGMREVATNLFELACLFDTPYSEAFFEAVLTASDYRSRLAEDVASPPLRAFLADLERRYPPQTLAAIARRLRAFSRNRLIRARYGLTGKELDRHGLPVAPKVRLEHHSPSLSVPMSIAAATALWSLIDLLLMIARRPRTAPGLLCVVEELSALLSATGNDPVLISLLLHVIRTARVTHAGLFLVSQGFATLDRTLHDELLLNAAAWVTFQSPSTGVADVIGAHLVAPRPPSAALVRRTLATLPPREAVLTVKGVGAVPFRTAELALPTGEALDRLAESFVRDFAPSSTLPITVIEDSLARFEQEFVFNRVRPSAKKARARELLGLGGDA